jgi:hypothetical protein
MSGLLEGLEPRSPSAAGAVSDRAYKGSRLKYCEVF